MKSCRICRLDKEEFLFVKSKAFKSGIDTICLKCSREKVKQWRQTGKRNHKAERDRALTRNFEKVKTSEQRRSRKYFEIHKRKPPRIYKTKEELLATKAKSDRKRTLAKKVANWANQDKIRQFYLEAQYKSKETGIKWVVDHIIPLCGKNVTGLHIETNLQVVPWNWNRQKANTFDGTEQLYK